MTSEWKACVSGAVAGLVQDAILHPVDTVRARLQVQNDVHSSNPVRAFASRGKRMVKREGLASFYRGFSTVFLFGVPANALYFLGYEHTRKRLVTWNSETSHGLGGSGQRRRLSDASVELMSGLGAEVAAACVWTPFEVVKQRMQVSNGKTGGGGGTPLSRVCRDVYRTSGVRGFYVGIGASLVVYAPYSALFFVTFETVKSLAIAQRSERPLPHQDESSLRSQCSDVRESVTNSNPIMDFVAGVVSGAVASAATQPMDCIKTRMQVSGTSDFLGTLRSALHAGGLPLLFQGTFARVLWLAPGSGISIMVYSATLRSLS